MTGRQRLDKQILASGSPVLRVLLLGIVVLASSIQEAHAQSDTVRSDSSRGSDLAQGEERRYTVAFVSVPLAEALERLIDETQLSIIYASERVEGKTTFCRAEHAAPEALLACVLKGTGLDYAQLSSGTYVLIPDPRGPPRYGRLAGLIVDAETGTPIADANVLLSGTGGTSTNEAGRFAFAALKPGPHRLVVTHVAYHTAADTVQMQPGRTGHTRLALRPRVVLSPPVVVNGFEARLPSGALGRGRRTAAQREAVAGVGTEDVVQDLGAVVGVRLGDALSDVHLQGGASDEQQFLLDSAPVFVPVPNGGFIGPFSPFAIQQVTVRKAGFGASRGSHLSGVIEIEHRLSPPEPLSLTMQVDPLSMNVRASGQAGSGERTAAWMLATREGLWEMYQPERLETLFRSWGAPDDFLLQALGRSEEQPSSNRLSEGDSAGDECCAADRLPVSGPLEVRFSDLHAAGRIGLGGLRSARISLYRGAGAFGIEGSVPSGPESGREFEDEYSWTNYAGHLRYEWVPGDRLFTRVETWASSYGLDHAFEPALARPDSSTEKATDAGTASNDFNEIREVGTRLGWDYAWTDLHQLSGAVEVVFTGSDFALSLDPLSTAPAVGPEALQPVQWRLAGFLEDEVALGERWRLAPGTRLTYLPQQKTLYAEPRLTVRYDQPAGRHGSWAVRAALGLYRQYLSSFDVATAGATALLPRMRFWLPVGREQRPPEAYHATATLLYRPNATWDLGAETYYKHQPHLWALNYGDYGARDAGDTAGLLTRAEGYAYGLALTAERRGEHVQAEAQYEYAIARRRVPGRFDGAYLPVPWSAPHRLRLAFDLAVLTHLTATVRWEGLFGRSWGFRQAYYDLLEPDPQTRRFPPFDLSEPDAHRLPVFSQWDVGLAYTRKVRGVAVQGRFALINALGRQNMTDWSLRYDEAGTHVRVPRRAVPRLPSLSLRLSW